MEIYKFSMKTSFKEIYIYIYIFFFLSLTYIHLICIHMLPIVLYLPLTPLTFLSLQFRPLLYYITSLLKFLFCI